MIAQTKTAVKYHPRAKAWQAINGKVESFPAGPDGKRAALLAALAHDHPELYAVVADVAAMHDHRPELVDRLLKAAQLVVKGHVFADHKVKSQSSEQVYKVSCAGTPAAWHCDCDDFERGQQRHAGLTDWGGVYTDYDAWPVCKHILAALVAELAGVELVDEPIPFEAPSARALPATVDYQGSIEDFLG